MDYRSQILAAIDALQKRAGWATAEEITLQAEQRGRFHRVAGELRKMAREGLVVYDRKASGWRRA